MCLATMAYIYVACAVFLVFWPVSNFTELHALTLVACSYALLYEAKESSYWGTKPRVMAAEAKGSCVPHAIRGCGTGCWVIWAILPLPLGSEQIRSWPAKGGHHWQLSTVIHISPRQCGQWRHARKHHPFHTSTTNLLHILNSFH